MIFKVGVDDRMMAETACLLMLTLAYCFKTY